jgi:predicted phage terminase large subunit-like protein
VAKGLTDQELKAWLYLQAIDGPQALLDFVPLATPWYSSPEHLAPLAKLFWRAGMGERVRALTSTPPQHGKSVSMLHWIAKYIKTNPSKVVAYVSYAAEVAHSKSKECREIAKRVGVLLSNDSAAAHEWRTPQGGGLIATGVGGPLTGHRVDLLVIDDPVKTRIVAESNILQQHLIDWARSTAFTRLSKNGSVIINMARWSQGDLIGRLIAEDTDGIWEIINLPAILDEGTENERALWEEGKPLEFLKDLRKHLIHQYDWAALYEGNPQPRGGGLFREPARYKFAEVSGARFAIACDPAATAKTSADHSAIAVVSATGDGFNQKVYVLDVWRVQVEIPELVEKLRQFQDNWRCPIFVESAGGFKAVAQLLRRTGPAIRDPRTGNITQDPLRVVEVTPLGDKFTRALPVSTAWNDGRVLIPEDGAAPWVVPFLSEVRKFTGKGDKYDDQIDCLAHAFSAVDRRTTALERGAKRVLGA